jgi:hypothetical protein
MSGYELTEAEWEEFRQRTADPSFGQDEHGIDVSLIDYMLSLTPTQRLEALEQLMGFADALAKARVRLYGEDTGTALKAERRRG